MEKVLNAVSNYLDAWGFSILTLIIGGFVIAILVEITIKKTAEWLLSKVDDKAESAVIIIKGISVLIATLALSVKFTDGIIAGMGLPGGAFSRLLWISAMYIVQWFFSLVGVKGLAAWWNGRRDRAIERAEAKALAKAEAEANKPKLTPVPGTKGLFTNELGEYVNAKGQKV